MKRHLKIHQTGEPGVIKCIKCKQVFTSHFDLKNHDDKNHTSKVSSPVNECSFCGKIFDRKVQLQVHVVKHETETPGVIICNYRECKQIFTSTSDLREHTAKHGDFSKSEKRPFDCDFPGCNYAFKKNHALSSHKRRVHDSDVWTCPQCGKIFKNSFSGLRHLRMRHETQQNTESSNLSGFQPTIFDEQTALVIKDEIEEVVFD
jgi:uncharacterized C2H2 Zn-finger protein